ncbi:hypothetical protein LTS18_011409 [Coniosporium uncinatum]|uniref:Uncharacterized protein n=1 Tax=Coniosporium uncinatum TaxID=93489 RepID=A0ACC3DYH9_9PEZI|nr:hypothetical protein LTS18_011409 [Coniosporium uncinatum]
MGSTYSAIERSIPGIAFSASNSEIAYTNITNTTNPATYAAQVAADIVQGILEATPEGQAVLPLGYGINVNIPALNDTYQSPPVVKSRLTGNADVDIAVYNATTGTFRYANIEPPAAGVNQCINGDCSLPGETYVVESGMTSISVYTVDYDAPATYTTDLVFDKFDAFAVGGNGTSGSGSGSGRGWGGKWGNPGKGWVRRSVDYRHS